MNMNMQNIINVGLGIIVGFLIWQNDIQQDTIKTLMEYDQIDTDKSFDRIDALEEKLATVEKDLELFKGIVSKDVVNLLNLETKYEYTTDALGKWQIALDNELSARIENTRLLGELAQIIDRNTDNIKVVDSNLYKLDERVTKVIEFVGTYR